MSKAEMDLKMNFKEEREQTARWTRSKYKKRRMVWKEKLIELR